MVRNLEYKKLTAREWNALMDKGEIEDLSHTLPESFLLFGQVMRAKIRYDGRIWLVSAWNTDMKAVRVDMHEIREEGLEPFGAHKIKET